MRFPQKLPSKDDDCDSSELVVYISLNSHCLIGIPEFSVPAPADVVITLPDPSGGKVVPNDSGWRAIGGLNLGRLHIPSTKPAANPTHTGIERPALRLGLRSKITALTLCSDGRAHRYHFKFCQCFSCGSYLSSTQSAPSALNNSAFRASPFSTAFS